MVTESSQTAETISGRATGALFFSCFGTLWLCTGLAAMHALNLISGSAVVGVAASLIYTAIQLLRRVANISPASTNPAISNEGDLTIKRTFSRVNAIQWIAIVAAVVTLNLLHHPEFIVPAIATIVGLHLFPLAALFRYPPHYVTGTLLVIWSIGVVTLFPAERIASTGALGTAAILLLSAAYTLTMAVRAARRVLAA